MQTILTDPLKKWITQTAEVAAKRMCEGKLVGCMEFQALLVDTCTDVDRLQKVTIEAIYSQSRPTILQEVGILISIKKHYYLVGFQVYLPYGFNQPQHSKIGITHLPNLNGILLDKFHIHYDKGM